ncbi:hypothetical protein RclHR1_29300002 [Rhizophagus clarus]|uniref:HAT C-terminal dimerisation domain-containing protein n=1 Tax=Rhizophagus clarus TaxID=94130 RepID=A0A2Z6R8B9_9GLOM|nr:hypothetical protein RclHR1_29300002 [Rhizophagus clarus]
MEKSITSIIKQELYQEINDSSFWSIMIDKTTFISNEKHLAIVSKHFLHNIPVLRYIRLIELENCITDNILIQILEFIQNNGLNLNSLIHFGSDDASTMVGCKNGVVAKLKELSLFLILVHCISHRLHLVEKNAANEVQYFKKYEAMCKELYSYFSKSYKRMLNLKMIQESNDDPHLHAGDQRDRDQAKKLLELVDSKLKISTMYMADLIYLLTILSQISLDATITTIKTRFISFDDQPPVYGTNLQQFIQNNSFYNNHIPDDFVHFAKALVRNLQACFPYNELYDSMKILDPKELPLQESALSSYGIEELKLLCEHFGNQKHKSNGTPVQPLINSSECKKEWQMVKHIMKSIRNYDIIEGWHHIWSTCPQFKNKFPNVNILVNIVLLVPLSNANVERVFSQHKLTKTRLRNKLNVKTLDMHLMILLNAPDNIEEFNWDKAFNQWKNEHVRRVNTNNF